MAVLPDVFKYFSEAVETNGIRMTRSANGTLYMIDDWAGLTKRAWKLTYRPPVTMAQINAFYTFWRTYGWSSFYFFEYDHRRIHTTLTVDEAATGSLDVFTIPGKETSSQTVYVAGTPSVNYVIDVGAGTNGEDQIDFGFNPSAGQAITITFTGRRRYQVAFTSAITDSMVYNPELQFSIEEV